MWGNVTGLIEQLEIKKLPCLYYTNYKYINSTKNYSNLKKKQNRMLLEFLFSVKFIFTKSNKDKKKEKSSNMPG